MSGVTWRFVRHYLEMVAAMLTGMAALGVVSWLVLDLPDRTAVELVEMAVWMTVPMTAWMRIRGHRWRVCGEMAAAMLLPGAVALALLGTGAVADAHTLVMLEHTVMFPAMLVAMLTRRDEYSGYHHEHPGADPVDDRFELDRDGQRSLMVPVGHVTFAVEAIRSAAAYNAAADAAASGPSVASSRSST